MRIGSWGKALVLWAGMVPALGLAADAGQAALVERVIAVEDACQRQALVAGVLQDLASNGHQLALASRPTDQALATFAWQQHLFHVYAGLAEQWPVAQWSRQGVQLAGGVHRGALDWEVARPDLLAWQQRRAQLTVPTPGCEARPPRAVRRLRADLVGWIRRAAAYKAVHETLQ